MTEPEPQLLSLLQKVTNPIQQLSLKIKINGIFAAPQQWKTSDQLNPNIFGYSIKLLGQQLKGGKIQPRKLTQKQQKQLQQKTKKPAKKQPKQDKNAPPPPPPPPQILVDPAEQQRKKREWDQLPEQQKFYRTQEDPYKSFSLKFQQNQKQISYTNQTITKLQQRITDGQIQLLLTRKPQLTQEQITKLKKSKPKNLNLAQLYPMVYKGIIKTKQFQIPGLTHLRQRAKVSLVPSPAPQAMKIQTDTCYIFIEFQCSQAITPQVKQIKPKTQQILPAFNPTQQKINNIQKLNLEIYRSIKSISQQYIACFAKQKQQKEKKHHNVSSISTLKLNQINKRKQVFLNQFLNSGKFALLQQRLSKSIKTIIIDKFRKQKQNSTISTKQINSTLSQLSLYFQQQFSKIIDQFMSTQSATIHQDLVLDYQNTRQLRKLATAPITNQTQIQRQTRLATQYQILQTNYQQGQIYQAQSHYMNVVMLSNHSIQSKQNYAKFCLKYRKFNQAFALYSQIAEQSQKLEHKLVKVILLMDRRRLSQVQQQISSMMQDKQCKITDKINYNILLSFMYERQNDIKNSQKYLAIAQRYFKIKNNPYLKFIPIENPYELPTPKIPKPERYTSQLTHTQSQQLRLNFIKILATLNFYNLVHEYLPKLDQSITKTIYQIQTSIFYKNYDDALTKIQSFLSQQNNNKNIDYLLLKSDICYRSDKMFQCEEIFLNILHLKPPSSKLILIYLRLGQTYLNRKSFQDAKQIFEKACEHKYNCSLAWLGLGISNLQLQRYQQAQQSLNLCKIYNPFSHEIDQYQLKINQHHKLKYQILQNKSLQQNTL